MKSKITILILMAIILVTCFIGCTEPKTNGDVNNNTTENGIDEIQVSLETVVLLESELNSVEKLNDEYIDEPYTVNNLTGNNITWNIKEAYFATFAGETSRVTESLIKLDSKEKVTQNLNLYKPYLLAHDLTEHQIDTIGDTSFLLNGSMIIKNNDTDFYIICFSIGDIIVTLHGYGSERNEIISYAEIIENKILDAMG